MRKRYKYLLCLFICLILLSINVFAKESTKYINISTNKISTDGKEYNGIKEYETLDDFLVDYNNGNVPEIYITNFLFDGVSSVKSPDLDDFIEDGNDAKVKTLEITVLNINTLGNIELTGESTGMMVAINSNDKKGDINLILNNVSIDTDTKKSPAIYVYNKDITNTDCKVTIKTKSGTKNYIEGGKFKKVSLMPKDDLDSYKKNYKSNNLTTYENYYGIYTKSELEKILFATVTADNEGLLDGDPYYFYKGSGAISSDIDLYFEGDGYLSVISKNKEGIETKGNLIFSGGTGDYEIHAKDDCLNTTTSSRVSKNIHNSIVIDVNSLVAVVDDNGDEGDAIDSNGTLTINGGKIFAFAHSNSGDAGLDSETGTIINGGEIISTGNMADKISNKSKQNYIYVSFNETIEKDALIVIKDENDNIITAFRTNKDITTLFYSRDDLDYKSFKIYIGGEISGNEENGLYKDIKSYENGKEISYKEVSGFDDIKTNKKNANNFILKLFLGEIVCLVIILFYIICDYFCVKRKNNRNNFRKNC